MTDTTREALQAVIDYLTGPQTRNCETDKAAANAARVALATAGQAAALLHPGSPEASAMIDSVLAEYNWPSNAKDAARAGYVAAQRLLATTPAVQATPVDQVMAAHRAAGAVAAAKYGSMSDAALEASIMGEATPAVQAQPAEWSDAQLRGIASDYFPEAKDWPAAMLCMRHLLMEQRKYPRAAPREQAEDAQRLSTDLTRAKALLVRIYDRHPEARSLIEASTGQWFVWGQDRGAARASTRPADARKDGAA
jgi:hypothetical protein